MHCRGKSKNSHSGGIKTAKEGDCVCALSGKSPGKRWKDRSNLSGFDQGVALQACHKSVADAGPFGHIVDVGAEYLNAPSGVLSELTGSFQQKPV